MNHGISYSSYTATYVRDLLYVETTPSDHFEWEKMTHAPPPFTSSQSPTAKPESDRPITLNVCGDVPSVIKVCVFLV